jgi:anti-repressor protein
LNELIKVNYESADRPTVMGRELHEALKIKTAYKDWFPRMCEYGFAEGSDYTPLIFEHPQNKQPYTDHQLTLDMAKELCMIQRTPEGKRFREYFIEVEKAWNDPVLIMGRALEVAKSRNSELLANVAQLKNTVAVQSQQITELQPKASYYDVVLNSKDLLSIGKIAKDFGKSAVWLNKWLHEQGVQYKQGEIWLLYQKYAEQGYTSTKTQPYNGDDGTVHTKVHTYWTQKGRLFIYDLLKAHGVLPLIEREVTS